MTYDHYLAQHRLAVVDTFFSGIGGGLSGRELCHGSEGTWVRVPLYTGLYLYQPAQANVLIEYILLIECGSRES